MLLYLDTIQENIEVKSSQYSSLEGQGCGKLRIYGGKRLKEELKLAALKMLQLLFYQQPYWQMITCVIDNLPYIDDVSIG